MQKHKTRHLATRVRLTCINIKPAIGASECGNVSEQML